MLFYVVLKVYSKGSLHLLVAKASAEAQLLQLSAENQRWALMRKAYNITHVIYIVYNI